MVTTRRRFMRCAGRTRPALCRSTPRRSSSAAGQTALQKDVGRIEAIGPTDLLSFVDPARRVRNGDFLDPVAGQQKLGGQLRLEVEADAAEAELLQHLAAKHFVARLHV